MDRFLKIGGLVLLGAALAVTLAFETSATVSTGAAISTPPQTRCGWFENSTPSNAWLIDSDGEWLISIQGGYQAEGDWPDFPDSRWVKTNVNYGYGCACMKVTVDRTAKRVLTILSATTRPLSTCRKDKALKGKEPD